MQCIQQRRGEPLPTAGLSKNRNDFVILARCRILLSLRPAINGHRQAGMLHLPQVTLVCVDTRTPRLALDAMQRSKTLCTFGDALLFVPPSHCLQDLPPDIRLIECEGIDTVEAYSRFLIKDLGSYISTSHILIVQWDGYVLNPSMWREDFLHTDYIGAVWPQFDDEHRVGNGGFSLRSRKLLDALHSDEITPQHPEDVCIARTHRPLLEQRWGIRFADEELAHQFAFERDRQTPSSFGFHGMSNMAVLMTEAELHSFMDQTPPFLFGSVSARGFIKHLIKRGMKPLARRALSMRWQSKRLDIADLRLWARLAF